MRVHFLEPRDVLRNMKRQLNLVIDVENQYCASETGEVCPYVASLGGPRLYCHLFVTMDTIQGGSKRARHTELRDETGVPSGVNRLVRLQVCKDAERVS